MGLAPLSVAALLTLFPLQEGSVADQALVASLEAVRVEAGLPAIGTALVTVEGLQGVWVTGARRAGHEQRVEADDIWHLGSCTKSMTATMIALLVTRGDLAWDTPLGEALPELVEEMDMEFGDLTLVELMAHRAGLPANPDLLQLARMRTSTAALVEQRAEAVRLALTAAPAHPPRGAFLYSNLGFVIAGHLAERRTGKSWEKVATLLIEEYQRRRGEK